jgi:hypothetical protein
MSWGGREGVCVDTVRGTMNKRWQRVKYCTVNGRLMRKKRRRERK